MKTQTGEIHVLRTGGCLKATKYKAQPLSMLWLNTGLASMCEETLQSLVLESYDHVCTVTWVVTGCKALTKTQEQRIPPLKKGGTTPLHPFTHSPIHPFTYSPIHLFTHSPIHLFTYSPIHRFTYSPIHRFTDSPIQKQESSHQLASQAAAKKGNSHLQPVALLRRVGAWTRPKTGQILSSLLDKGFLPGF